MHSTLLLMYLGLGSTFLGNVEIFSTLSSCLGSDHEFCLTPGLHPTAVWGWRPASLIFGWCLKCLALLAPMPLGLRPGLRLHLSRGSRRPCLACAMLLSVRPETLKSHPHSLPHREPGIGLPWDRALEDGRGSDRPWAVFLFAALTATCPLLFSDSG